jgi:hypothetical protein
MKKRNAEIILLLGFVLLKFILQYLLVNDLYDLHRDEYLHLDQADHLAAGYVSVPPFTSWNSVVIQLLGGSSFWVRFFPALYGALTLVVVWQLVGALNGGLYAKVLAASALLLSALLRINMLYQPNSFDVLCWTLVFYLTIRFVQTQASKWLILLGLVVGIGSLNKYNLIFLLIGLLPALALSPHRTVFLNRYFYVALLIALVLILPNVIWQFQNGLPVIHHMSSLQETQLQNMSRLDFLKDQIIFFLGAFYLILAALVALAVYEPFKPYRFVGVTYLLVIVLYVCLRAKGYYAIGLYPVLIGFGSVYWEYLFRTGWKRYLRPVWIIGIVAAFVPVVTAVFPVKTPVQIHANAARFKSLNLLKWEDGKDHTLPQDFADMLGWKELADKAALAFAQVPEAEKPYTLVLCDNYGETGAVNYYAHGRLNPAVSFNADYVHWFPMDKPIKNVVLIKEAGEEPLEASEKWLFDSVTRIGSIENPYAREYGASVYLLTGARPELKDLLQKRISELTTH